MNYRTKVLDVGGNGSQTNMTNQMKHSIIGSILFIAQFLNVPIAAQRPAYKADLWEDNTSLADICEATIDIQLCY